MICIIAVNERHKPALMFLFNIVWHPVFIQAVTGGSGFQNELKKQPGLIHFFDLLLLHNFNVGF